jgi:hypothetical protein
MIRAMMLVAMLPATQASEGGLNAGGGVARPNPGINAPVGTAVFSLTGEDVSEIDDVQYRPDPGTPFTPLNLNNPEQLVINNLGNSNLCRTGSPITYQNTGGVVQDQDGNDITVCDANSDMLPEDSPLLADRTMTFDNIGTYERWECDGEECVYLVDQVRVVIENMATYTGGMNYNKIRQGGLPTYNNGFSSTGRFAQINLAARHSDAPATNPFPGPGTGYFVQGVPGTPEEGEEGAVEGFPWDGTRRPTGRRSSSPSFPCQCMARKVL